jgi:cytosine/adenosine deaminase-related metal-dependent hydrolase
MSTVVKNAAWAIPWNEALGRHEYARGIDVAFDGSTITHVGKDYRGQAEQVIDGRGVMVMPGLINTHTHPWSEALNKGFAEDFGNPALGFMAMYDWMPGWIISPRSCLVAASVAYAELLKSGTTTIIDNSPIYEGWIDMAARSGMRSYLGPAMASAGWTRTDASSYGYKWKEDDGAQAFETAMAAIDAAETHPAGTLSGIVFPGQVDTCSEAFLRRCLAEASDRKRPLQIHAAQSEPEYHEMVRRHGKSPIAWLDDLGLLRPQTIIGHGIFLNDHSWIKQPGDDLDRLAKSGATVAHSPTVFARTAAKLENFGRYRQAGVNVALGTDTYPHDLFEEMRLALYLSRTDARRIEGSECADVFAAATIGGAEALGRADLGRLAVGCKADLLLVEIDHPLMQPARDPLRSMISSAGSRPIRDVIIDGKYVVRDHEVVTLDYRAAIAELIEIAACH